jgi:hypothetical protein
MYGKILKSTSKGYIVKVVGWMILMWVRQNRMPGSEFNRLVVGGTYDPILLAPKEFFLTLY